MEQYYVVSLSHTNKKDNYVTIWRPDNAGYCWSREQAGVYDSFQPGYHDSETNIAVEKSTLDKYFLPVVYDGKNKHMIPNCQLVWDALGVRWSRTGLRRKEAYAQ